MELSKETLNSIVLLGEPSVIPDKQLSQILQDVISAVLNGTRNSVMEERYEGNGSVKSAFFGALCFFLEAAKHNTDEATLISTLEECKVKTERISELVNFYKKEKKHLQAHLNSLGSHFPHLVDVDWRHDYVIKSDSLEKVCHPVYIIDLKTDTKEQVTFSCSIEELQDLVGKLKDATKCLEHNVHN
ncbi:COMM domain-containing protein 3-like [Centruroides sculpturatus]|uniref:COMM domain-containing protein 3-like n=1 Tax=Centruroides sculpturatus TaxID=218467 RepID=UPI000C6E7308|nr:COMM domain-containing protein 3-like [Centruroides sculpturatus]